MLTGLRIGVNAARYAALPDQQGSFVPTQNLLSASGIVRLVENYNGPLMRIRRDSDALEQDIGVSSGSDKLNLDAIESFRNGSTVRVTTLYDQSGNGHHKTQTSESLMPELRTELIQEGLQPLGLFNDRLQEPIGFTGDRQNVSDYHIYSPMSIKYNTAHRAVGGLGDSWNSTGAFSMLAERQFRSLSNTAFENYNTVLPLSQKQIMAWCSRSDGRTIHINDSTESKSAISSQTFTRGWIGYVGGINYTAYGRWYGRVTYATGHDDQQAQSVKNALYSAFTIPITKPHALIAMGNSIVEGAASTYTRGYIQRLDQHLTTSTHISNFGVYGQTMAAQHTDRAQYASFYVDSTASQKTMILLAEPTNDLESRSSGTILGYGTTLFNDYFIPLAQDMTAAGYEGVIAPTILQRDWIGSATDISEKETERLIYNQLIRDNAAIYGASVIDFAAIEASIVRPDGIHPDDNGHEQMAILLANHINNLT